MFLAMLYCLAYCGYGSEGEVESTLGFGSRQQLPNPWERKQFKQRSSVVEGVIPGVATIAVHGFSDGA